MPSARPPTWAITDLHHLAHVLRLAGAGLGDRCSDHRIELGVVELGGEVALDQLGLGLLLLGELGAAAVAELRRGLQPALALAPEHRQLVVAAVLGRLLELGQHQPQRADALLLAGLHRAGHIAANAAR